jgi:hypothetical protein
MQQQTLNYYRFWMVMVGIIGVILSLHPFMGFLAGLVLAFGGIVLPMFKGKIMSVSSKIEDKVGEKIAQNDGAPEAVVESQPVDEDNKAA